MKNTFFRHFFLLSVSLVSFSVLAITFVASEKKVVALAKEKTNTEGIESCETILSGELREQCRNSRIQSIAKKEKNTKECEKITQETKRQECKDEVLYSISLSEGKFEYCDSINSVFLKEKCKKEREKYISENAKSIEDCSGISSLRVRKICEGRFRQNQGKEIPLSPKECEKISSKTERESCMRSSLSHSIKNSESFSVCNQFTGDIQNECKEKMNQKIDFKYKKIAIEQGKPSLCKEILSSERREECKDATYYQLAWTQKDSRYCKLIENEQNLTNCLEEYGTKIDLFWITKAMREKKSSLCENVVNSKLQNECTQSITEQSS